MLYFKNLKIIDENITLPRVTYIDWYVLRHWVHILHSRLSCITLSLSLPEQCNMKGIDMKRALNDDQIREILMAYYKGVTQAALVAKYGVSQTTISNIVRGFIYRGAQERPRDVSVRFLRLIKRPALSDDDDVYL